MLYTSYLQTRLQILAVRRLPRMQEVVGSNPTEGKIRFSHECESLFLKTILNLKTIKFNK